MADCNLLCQPVTTSPSPPRHGVEALPCDVGRIVLADVAGRLVDCRLVRADDETREAVVPPARPDVSERTSGSFARYPGFGTEVDMDQDRIIGAAKDFAGKAQGAAGDLVGDAKLSVEGRAREAAGTVQNMVGQAKDTARQVADQAADVASQAYDRSREYVDQGRQYVDQGRRYIDDARQRYPDADRYYREGTEMVRGQVQDSPLVAIAIAGAVGYLLAVLIHSRR